MGHEQDCKQILKYSVAFQKPLNTSLILTLIVGDMFLQYYEHKYTHLSIKCLLMLKIIPNKCTILPSEKNNKSK